MTMIRHIILMAVMALAAITAQAQQVTYQIKYSYEYDMQKYDYIKRLDYDEGTVVKDGDRQVTLKGVVYQVQSKDREVNDEKRYSLQYTVKDSQGAEYIICFNKEYSFTDELKYQVVFFSAANPYHWMYYITDSGK